VRIGVLTTSYPRDDDDASGAFVAGFSRWLAAHVGDVEVLCADDARPIFYRGGAPHALAPHELAPRTLAPHELAPRTLAPHELASRTLATVANWRHAAAFTRDLLRSAHVRARRWDAIVSHWLVPSALVGDLVARGRRHLAIAHGSDMRIINRAPFGGTFMRRLARRADVVYVASALRHPHAPGRVAPMGIDAARFSIDVSRRQRARHQFSLARFSFLFLGRLIRDKGCDLAIDALPDGCALLVAGDGPERATLEKSAAQKDVRFLGHVAGEARLDAFAAADALVIPSRSDGAPTVALEAMAAGLPIIATRAGGLPELVGDGETGLLCDATIENLRRAMSIFRDDTQLLSRLADKSLHEAKNHDWRVAGPRIWGRVEVAEAPRQPCIHVMRV
jgi:glycosyltransferase involved in cell wall biosynthesis